jgi:hypothetical protein
VEKVEKVEQVGEAARGAEAEKSRSSSPVGSTQLTCKYPEDPEDPEDPKDPEDPEGKVDKVVWRVKMAQTALKVIADQTDHQAPQVMYKNLRQQKPCTGKHCSPGPTPSSPQAITQAGLDPRRPPGSNRRTGPVTRIGTGS